MAFEAISFVGGVSQGMTLPLHLTLAPVPTHLLATRGPVAIYDVSSLAALHLAQWIWGSVDYKVSEKKIKSHKLIM